MNGADVFVAAWLVEGPRELRAGQQQVRALRAIAVGKTVRRPVVVAPSYGFARCDRQLGRREGD
jgi:hypothetical protein